MGKAGEFLTDSRAKKGSKADINTDHMSAESMFGQCAIRFFAYRFGLVGMDIAGDIIATNAISWKRQGREEVKDVEAAPNTRFDQQKMDNFLIYDKEQDVRPKDKDDQ